MKPSIVFLGNAQAHALYANWVARVPGAHQYKNYFIHYQHVSNTDRSVIGAASVIVSQMSDIENFDFHELNPTAHNIRFPYVNGAFLWPYCGYTHPHWGSSLMHQCGVFAGEAGDSFLGRLFLKRVSTSEAVNRYAELDIIKAANINRRYELAMDMQRVRDKKADLGYDTASYIDQNLSKKILFLSRQAFRNMR